MTPTARDAGSPSAGPGPRIGGRERLVFLLCWLPHAWLVHCFWYVTDDAFITFRYAKNLAAGFGPRYNLGDGHPVEGYSNFLWMLLCSGFEALGLDIEVWPLLVSAACATVFLWLAYRLFLLRLELPLSVAAVATLLLGLHPPFAVYATSGLAMMPYSLALFVAVERLVLRRGAPDGWGGGAALLCLALLRVEGIEWALVVLVLAAVSRALARERFAGALAKAALLLVVVYGTYWAWRYSYYGRPFPNTVYAKSGIRAVSPARWFERGFDYVASQWLTHLAPFATLLALPSAFRRGRRAIGLPVALLALAFPVYSILASGDFMAMSRFLVPGWVFACILVAWLLADLTGDGASAVRRVAVTTGGLALVAVGALSAFDVRLVPDSVRDRFHFRWNTQVVRSEYEQWEIMAWNSKRWAVLGRALKKWLPEGSSAAWGSIGAVGYYSDLTIYDTNGLVTEEVAMRNFIQVELKSPGHDRRVDAGYFVSRNPTLLKAEIVDGLPGAGDQRSPEDARGLFAQLFATRWIDPLHDDEFYRDRYVADFRPLPGWEDDACQPFGRTPLHPFAPPHQPRPNQVLVMWRHFTPGSTTGEEWAELRQRLLRFQSRGGDPYRRELRSGWPVPKWADARVQALGEGGDDEEESGDG